MTSYISRIKRLRIVITPGKPVYDGGKKVGDIRGVYAQFESGKYETNDKKIIEVLDNMPTFGKLFFKENGGAQAKTETKTDFDVLTKKELLAMAADKGIAVPDNAKKDEIINLINSAGSAE